MQRRAPSLRSRHSTTRLGFRQRESLKGTGCAPSAGTDRREPGGVSARHRATQRHRRRCSASTLRIENGAPSSPDQPSTCSSGTSGDPPIAPTPGCAPSTMMGRPSARPRSRSSSCAMSSPRGHPISATNVRSSQASYEPFSPTARSPATTSPRIGQPRHARAQDGTRRRGPHGRLQGTRGQGQTRAQHRAVQRVRHRLLPARRPAGRDHRDRTRSARRTRARSSPPHCRRGGGTPSTAAPSARSLGPRSTPPVSTPAAASCCEPERATRS